MQRDVFYADEIFPRGKRWWNRSRLWRRAYSNLVSWYFHTTRFWLGSRVQHTKTRPLQRSPPKNRMILIDLKPNLTTPIPSRHRMSLRHLRHIPLYSANMRNLSIWREPDLRPSGYSRRPRRRFRRTIDIAADAGARDVRDGAIALDACPLPGILPVGGHHAVCDELGECVVSICQGRQSKNKTCGLYLKAIKTNSTEEKNWRIWLCKQKLGDRFYRLRPEVT
jgi:hypothetical protein